MLPKEYADPLRPLPPAFVDDMADATTLTSPGAAYRVDLAGRATPFGPDDDRWLQIACELHLAAMSRGDDRRASLYEAIGLTVDLFGDEFIDGRAEYEWQRNLGYVEALVVLADVMQEASAYHLAAVLLDDLLLAAADITGLQRGRILAQRARIEWKLGRLDDAFARFEALEALGRRIRSPELRARAVIGLGAVAQQRGNFPMMHECVTKALRIALKHEFRSIERVARQGLMVVAAKNGRHGESLQEGWKVLELSRGRQDLEVEILQNMGQLLLEAGHPAAARACFAAVLSRTHATRLLLNALSGLALASARSGSEATVEWAVRELWRAQKFSVPRHDLAMALVEAAQALHVTGRVADAIRYRDAGAAIARNAGFHEVEFRAEALADGPAAAALDQGAQQVVLELQALEPTKLPEHVTYAEAAS
jgi:tetratricopeptide (TPR) repeat protein